LVGRDDYQTHQVFGPVASERRVSGIPRLGVLVPKAPLDAISA
jgi:hypothetical protein